MLFNVQAIVLKMLLVAEPKVAMSTLARLQKDFFNSAFTSIYASIQAYYKKHHVMPTLDSLALEANRNAKLSQALAVLANTPIPAVDIEHALGALEAEYTQDLFLTLLDTEVLRDITALDKGELINRVASLALKLEEKVTHTGNMLNANQISVFKEKNSLSLDLIPLGLCNDFDNYSGGIGRTEVFYIGGWRGTGKSVVCSNIHVNHYYQQLVTPYFSIEMKPEEVLFRNLAIMSGTSALDIKTQRSVENALQKLALTRAQMFEGGEELFRTYTSKNTVVNMSDFYELDQMLMEKYALHTPMIIIGDSDLSTAKLDAGIGRLKAEYGYDRVTTTIVDYINQVKLEGANQSDMYDWKDQMVVSKTFKNICVKQEVAGISPYQIDENGNARMSKGILDSCDVAAVLNAAKNDRNEGAIKFDLVKARSLESKTFMPKINWNTLRIDGRTNLNVEEVVEMQAQFVIPLDAGAKPAKKAPAKKAASSSSEEAADL